MVVHGLNHLRRRRQSHLCEDEVGEQSRRPALVELPHDRRQSRATYPKPSAFVSQEVSPPAGAGSPAGGIASKRDRASSRDDDNAGCLFTDAGHECDECVVDDDGRNIEAQLSDQAANAIRIVFTIRSCDADADRLWT